MKLLQLILIQVQILQSAKFPSPTFVKGNKTSPKWGDTEKDKK